MNQANSIKQNSKFILEKLPNYISFKKQPITGFLDERKVMLNNESVRTSLFEKFLFVSPRNPLSMFQIIKTLGIGTLGNVKLARFLKSRLNCEDPNMKLPSLVALKEMDKARIIRYKQVDHINNEKAILLEISHPFTITCYGSFQSERMVYLILEPVQGGEFFYYLRKQKFLGNLEASFYAAQICEVFDYLHGLKIVYRDLKPENLLIGPDGYLKMADFGFAKRVENRTYTICGTPEYIAPEMLLSKGHGRAVDWWTLGILIYEMLVGRPPFFDEEPIGIYKKIIDGYITYPLSMDRHARYLISKLLEKDLGKRWGNLLNGSRDIKQCKWFSEIKFQELINKRIKSQYIPPIKDDEDFSNFDCTDQKNLIFPTKEELSSEAFINW